MFLDNIKTVKLSIIPIVGGIFCMMLWSGIVSKTAQPIKFKMPNQIASVGITRHVISEIANPHILKKMPLRILFSTPGCQTKPDTNMNVRQIACCQICM